MGVGKSIVFQVPKLRSVLIPDAVIKGHCENEMRLSEQCMWKSHVLMPRRVEGFDGIGIYEIGGYVFQMHVSKVVPNLDYKHFATAVERPVNVVSCKLKCSRYPKLRLQLQLAF